MQRDDFQSTRADAVASPEDCPHQLVDGLQEIDLESMSTMESSMLELDASVAPTLEPATEMVWSEGRATLVPGRPDFVMSYATLPGASAFRDRDMGSLYVNELVNCLSQRLELDRALKMVSLRVHEELMRRNDEEEKPTRFQLPFHLTSGMDKLITL